MRLDFKWLAVALLLLGAALGVPTPGFSQEPEGARPAPTDGPSAPLPPGASAPPPLPPDGPPPPVPPGSSEPKAPQAASRVPPGAPGGTGPLSSPAPASGRNEAGYYARKGQRPSAPPASPAPPTSRDGKGGSSSGGTERRLVYEFFIFDLLLCLVAMVVTRDAWLSDRLRRHEPEDLPWQWDAAPRPGTDPPHAPPPATWLRRLQGACFDHPRGLATFAGVLVVTSVTVTLLLYGSMAFVRLDPGRMPDLAPRSKPLPFNSTAPRVARPYRMPGIFLATSTNGVAWEKQPGFTATRGGTHKMVVGGQGAVWAYVADAEHALERATVTPKGFEDISRVEIRGESQKLTLDPCAVPLNSERPRFRLYYVCTSRAGDPAAADARNEVHSAVSDDGLHFEREEGTRLAGLGITDPDVVRLTDGSWRMYYTEFPGSIRSARSADGLVFRVEGLRFANASVSSSLVEADGTTRLWFQSLDARLKGAIHAASSRDGLAFAIDGREVLTAGRITAPDGHGAFHPAVVRAGDGSYWMLYSSGEVFSNQRATESERSAPPR